VQNSTTLVRSKAKKRKLPKASPDRYLYERAALDRGVFRLAGVDEAGRGPLAGPVVAAGLVFPTQWIQQGLPTELLELNDSKALSAKKRERLFAELQGRDEIQIGLAVVDAPEIDERNILKATHVAMARALSDLPELPELALVDGLAVPDLPCPSQNIVKGDTLSLIIGAASIIAKVSRDQLMFDLDTQYPEYGFAKHKGYGTKLHLAALKQYGPCPAHRRSFAPVRASIPNTPSAES